MFLLSNQYDKKLGTGAYKDVFLAYNTVDGIDVAWNTVSDTIGEPGKGWEEPLPEGELYFSIICTLIRPEVYLHRPLQSL